MTTEEGGRPRVYCIDLEDGRVACLHLVRYGSGWMAVLEVRAGSRILARLTRVVPRPDERGR
mgnify:CR=1 FL=1